MKYIYTIYEAHKEYDSMSISNFPAYTSVESAVKALREFLEMDTKYTKERYPDLNDTPEYTAHYTFERTPHKEINGNWEWVAHAREFQRLPASDGTGRVYDYAIRYAIAKTRIA